MSSRAKLTGKQKLKSLAIVSTCAAGFVVAVNIAKGNERFYDNVLMPVVRQLPPEFSHQLAVFACKHRLFPEQRQPDPASLHLRFLGHQLRNPIGIAAGFDKHGDAIAGLADIGFGFVEIGSVTPEPQPGNPQPRVFRLHADRAIINRYGFNSVGHTAARQRILDDDAGATSLLGINLGKNKSSTDAAADYVAGVGRFADIAGYLVINVSSPNTPGLRTLQHQDELRSLLAQVLAARDALAAARPDGRRVPVALKLAPDLSDAELLDVARVIERTECRVDALIVSNTTVERVGLLSGPVTAEAGGLSGAPLAARSTEMVARVYRLTGGRVPIVGVGGVFSGRDAYEKILAGASVVQIYTAFAWHGPPVVGRIKRELAELLHADGWANVAEAVGKGPRAETVKA